VPSTCDYPRDITYSKRSSRASAPAHNVLTRPYRPRTPQEPRPPEVPLGPSTCHQPETASKTARPLDAEINSSATRGIGSEQQETRPRQITHRTAVVAHHKNTKFRHKDTAQPAHYSVGINVATRAKSVDQPRTSRTYYFCGASRADSMWISPCWPVTGGAWRCWNAARRASRVRASCDGSVALHNSRGAVCTGGPMDIAGCPPTVNDRVGACGAHQRSLCAGACPGTEVDHD
jgi:hypothetical protein